MKETSIDIAKENNFQHQDDIFWYADMIWSMSEFYSKLCIFYAEIKTEFWFYEKVVLLSFLCCGLDNCEGQNA